jgi:hypothetical protein
MKYCKLRIAWSVAWGIAGLLLIALWVRGHYIRDQLLIRYTAARFLWIVSEPTRLAFTTRPASTVTNHPDTDWIFRHERRQSSRESLLGYPDKLGKFPSLWRIQVMQFAKKTEISVPKWNIVVVALALSGAPWILSKWRFSLRTLLIAMTLVAVGLGLIVYASRID